MRPKEKRKKGHQIIIVANCSLIVLFNIIALFIKLTHHQEKNGLNHNQTFTLDLPNQHLIKERNKKYQENKETIVKIISTNRLFALRSTKQHNNLSVQNLTTLRHFGSKLVQLYLLCNQNILKKKNYASN